MDAAPPPPSPAPRGTVRLFTVSGIRVYLHWSWALVAWLIIHFQGDRYEGQGWAVAEYLSLFGIVLLHEFGHALASRQVGGSADTILLWPLGGIAYIRLPQRPAAQLWGLVAGPLVNVLLWPLFYGLLRWGELRLGEDAFQFVATLYVINLILLTFNLLPIYPLDGGQILRTLLWFKFGSLRSLEMAAILGVAGGIALGLVGWFWLESPVLPVLMVYLLSKSWKALKLARAHRISVAAYEAK